MPKSVLVINGPNLNLLGTREPHLYGTQTLVDIERSAGFAGAQLGLETTWFQSNHEGAIVDAIQQARGQYAGLVVNAGAYTHTSIAIRDALAAIGIPFIEVHLSNVHAREAFRAHSYLSDIAAGVIVGCGPIGYELALRALAAHLVERPRSA